MKITWHDSGLEPQCPSDPRWPNGIDLDLSSGEMPCCIVPLEYPAARCGAYMIECEQCGKVVYVSTAGRADDPKSVKVACHNGGMSRAGLK